MIQAKVCNTPWFFSFFRKEMTAFHSKCKSTDPHVADGHGWEPDMQHPAPTSTIGTIAHLYDLMKTSKYTNYMVDQNPHNFRKVVNTFKVTPTEVMKLANNKTKRIY